MASLVFAVRCDGGGGGGNARKKAGKPIATKWDAGVTSIPTRAI